MQLNKNSQTYAHLAGVKGYFLVPIRETKSQRNDGVNRNTVSTTFDGFIRRRAVEWVDSQTVLSLLGYSHANAYKILPADDRNTTEEDWARLDDFLSLVRIHREELERGCIGKQGKPSLYKFVELAVTMFAKTEGLKVKKVWDSPQTKYSQPYMVVVD